jgi:hypothetical protein
MRTVIQTVGIDAEHAFAIQVGIIYDGVLYAAIGKGIRAGFLLRDYHFRLLDW